MDKILIKIGDVEYDTGSYISGQPALDDPEDWWGVVSSISGWICGNATDPEEAHDILRNAI